MSLIWYKLEEIDQDVYGRKSLEANAREEWRWEYE